VLPAAPSRTSAGPCLLLSCKIRIPLRLSPFPPCTGFFLVTRLILLLHHSQFYSFFLSSPGLPFGVVPFAFSLGTDSATQPSLFALSLSSPGLVKLWQESISSPQTHSLSFSMDSLPSATPFRRCEGCRFLPSPLFDSTSLPLFFAGPSFRPSVFD